MPAVDGLVPPDRPFKQRQPIKGLETHNGVKTFSSVHGMPAISPLDQRKVLFGKDFTFGEASIPDHDMFLSRQHGVAVGEDSDVGDAVLVCVVRVRHVRASAMMEGAVARLQGDGYSFVPLKLRAETEEAALVAQVLRGQVVKAMRFGQKAHAPPLHRHID